MSVVWGPPCNCGMLVGPHRHGAGTTTAFPEQPARPAAGDTRTDRERLREVIANGLRRQVPGGLGAGRAIADAVLALPEVAALLDAAESSDPTEPRPLAEQARELVIENRRLTEKVRRVEEAAVCPTLCDDDCETDCHEGHQPRFKRMHQPQECPSVYIRRALDGDAS